MDLFRDSSSTAHALLVLGLVASVGLAIGSIRLFTVHLGVAGVLFAGLAFGHFKVAINHEVLDFARELGLILFVYTIGVQVGPGFLASLRRNGLPLNLMAAGIVLLGVATTLGLYYTVLNRDELPAAVGLFSGATTNTPSLAAAQEAIKDRAGDQFETLRVLPGLGYAVAYPFGVVGIILTILLTRWMFRIDPEIEANALAKLHADAIDPIAAINLEVNNPNVVGVAIGSLPVISTSGVVISRILHDEVLAIARTETRLSSGDVILAVGPRAGLEQLRMIVGPEAKVNLKELPSKIVTRRILVTNSAVLGDSIADLRLRERFDVSVTRIERNAIELPVTSNIGLAFGDRVTVVGDEQSINAVAKELGDSIKKMNFPQMIPIFLGVALGVIVGSWPIHVPGLPSAVKLGLAGGPLLVAIVLSRVGSIGPLVWFLPTSAGFTLREVGIALFLACVGLKAGDRFVETIVHGRGLIWLGCGVAITLVPLLVVALLGRLAWKMNYLTLCGLLAGSMTDPPALAFATTMTKSDAPSVSYATVYPLTMILRVLCAQLMILIFM